MEWLTWPVAACIIAFLVVCVLAPGAAVAIVLVLVSGFILWSD